MQYSMVLFVADKQINNFMEDCDLKSKEKWFVSPVKVSFQKETNIIPEYFMKIINLSKQEDSFWIPAIEFCEAIYHDKNVNLLSDGQHIIECDF